MALHSGASYVVFGKAAGFTAEINVANWTVATASSSAALRQKTVQAFVSSAGDVNGDGFADVIVGAPFHSLAQAPGQSYVVFGKASGFDRQHRSRQPGRRHGFKCGHAAIDNASGRSVASAGDINGDGYADIMIGAPQATTGADLFSGLDPRALYRVARKGFGANIDLSTLTRSQGFRAARRERQTM